MILATAYFRFAVLRLLVWTLACWIWLLLALALGLASSSRFAVFFAAPLARRREERRGRVLAGARAVAFHRAAAAEHHVGVVLLGGAGHDRRQMLERVAVGGAELGGEIDVAAEFQHAVVVALEHRVGLLRREFEFLQVLRLVGLEGPAVLVLHQRHAEHVDAIALARAFGIEHESARDIVIYRGVRGPSASLPSGLHIYSAGKLGNVPVMPGLVPGIHVFIRAGERRGWPGQARP